MKQGEEMARVGQRASKGLLLHGAAGSGKTQLVKGMATEANATLFSLEPTQVPLSSLRYPATLLCHCLPLL